MKKEGYVVINLESNHVDSQLKFCAYHEHLTFRDLRAKCVCDRLQLAALYSMTSSLLPEPRGGMRGWDTAMHLLRGSHVDHPLDAKEFAQLQNIVSNSVVCPSVVLMCKHLELCATRLKFLHDLEFYEEIKENQETKSVTIDIQNSKTAYSSAKESGNLNVRLFLTPVEEQRLFGIIIHGRHWVREMNPLINAQLLPNLECVSQDSASFVKQAENQLKQEYLKIEPKAIEGASSDFICPVTRISDGKLECEMFEELEESFRVSQELPSISLATTSSTLFNLIKSVEDMEVENTKHRDTCERILFSASDCIPSPSSSLRSWVQSFKIRRCALLEPTPNIRDWIECLLGVNDETIAISALNPFLLASKNHVTIVSQAVITWLELSVFSEKLIRIKKIAISLKNAASDDQIFYEAELIKELLAVREWETHKYPRWLALEIDCGIQIRPEQYKVANKVINGNGDILQLNMGEGKTRVIIPMIILELTIKSKISKERSHLLRVMFLSSLRKEAFEFMHERLTGGLINIRLGEMPFNRDIQLTPLRASTMYAYIKDCIRDGIPLLLAPEYICSLHLKELEIIFSGHVHSETICNILSDIKQLPSRDVIDESDEVLKHKYQLIYSAGDSRELPALSSRCKAVFSVLKVIHTDPTVRKMLSDPRIATIIPSSYPEAFVDYILLLETSGIRSELLNAIINALVRNPPRELKWLKILADNAGEARIKRFVLEWSVNANEIIDPSACPNPSMYETLLALRGLLGHGILEHCLSKRHRVDYGCAPELNRKRVAIPFRAADVPAERSEFCHADVVIVFTTLSYYYQFLTQAQVIEALEKLLLLGESAQDSHYEAWLDSSKSSIDITITKAEFVLINSTRKLDLSNSTQVDILYRAFGRNCETISYWLQFCCFPGDTIEYPGRRKASAWHLAMGSSSSGFRPCGFSGTNDQHRLLPLQVKQSPLPDAKLMATNGFMLSCMMRHMTYFGVLPSVNTDFLKPWQQLLQFAIDGDFSAIIDAGALLCGISGVKLAEFVLEKLQLKRQDKEHPLRAVVYFNNTLGSWMVRSCHSEEWNLTTSPIRECDAFVIFGERHCRGSDMKLRHNATAVITLGPNMCKDKLMQAAGRLRKLGVNQKLTAVALPEVHLGIKRSVGIDDGMDVECRHVLQWVMANTVDMSSHGLREWALNGVHFLTTNDSPEASLLDIKMELYDLYGDAVCPRKDCIAVENAKSDLIEKRNEAVSSEAEVMLDKLMDKVKSYESAIVDNKGGAQGEECEREMEQEEEEEEEAEKEVEKDSPRSQVAWDFNAVPYGFSSICNATTIIPLADEVRDHLSPQLLTSIPWGRVYFTDNFIKTVMHRTEFNRYLRPVDALLLFENDCSLLLTDFEASSIVDILARCDSTCGARLVHLSFLKTKLVNINNRVGQSRNDWLTLPSLQLEKYFLPSPRTLVSIQLFNGDTKYEYAFEELEEMTRMIDARRASIKFPEMRSFAMLIEKSDLEQACETHDCVLIDNST